MTTYIIPDLLDEYPEEMALHEELTGTDYDEEGARLCYLWMLNTNGTGKQYTLDNVGYVPESGKVYFIPSVIAVN